MALGIGPGLATMAEGMARHWVEQALARWPKGIARFSVTIPPSDGCCGQIGIQINPAARRAEAFYWLDSGARRRGLATDPPPAVRSSGAGGVDRAAHEDKNNQSD